MEELKSKLKELVPGEKHVEVDRIFDQWMSTLKVHTVLEKDELQGTSKEEVGDESEKSTEEVPTAEATEEEAAQPQGKSPLKQQIEELKKQIERFKQKMKTYKDSTSDTTDMALNEVQEEITRVRDAILKMRENFAVPEKGENDGENVELLNKLDEVKQFLEKLK